MKLEFRKKITLQRNAASLILVHFVEHFLIILVPLESIFFLRSFQLFHCDFSVMILVHFKEDIAQPFLRI